MSKKALLIGAACVPVVAAAILVVLSTMADSPQQDGEVVTTPPGTG